MEEHPESELSVRDVQGWLEQELRDLSRALELRTKEASAIADEFARGAISVAEVEERLAHYSQRWDEALPGTNDIGQTDADLVHSIDRLRLTEQRRVIDAGRGPFGRCR